MPNWFALSYGTCLFGVYRVT